MPINDLEVSFLEDILDSVEGIGDALAANVISKRDDFENFNTLELEEIEDIRYLGEDSAIQVIKEFSEVDFSRDIKDLYVERVIDEFLEKQYENVRKLDLDHLDINVLLIKALGFSDAEEAIEFYLYQRVTRSVVTSWGTGALEKICKIAGSQDVPQKENVSVSGKAFDVKKETEDETYYIQIKSGPNTMNVGMVESLNDMITRIEQKHEDATGMLGMTYGKSSQVSNQIKGNLNNFEEKAMSGKEFWSFLSGEESYYMDLIGQIDQISAEFEEEFNKTFLELVNQKEEELKDEWEKKYGSSGKKGLDNFWEQYAS